ncbi:hypothetical protein IFM89_036357 [Coptis chinensis]|uniref:Uncharacterized protein n=1 Tax=Coptis chinensis TaxID=261450 RepID=A0A835LTS3_9MAGN|nr:hypothetical protein IFM89_036357 [Coptis chinensis]
MGVDETSDTPMEVNNTQDSSVERTGRGAVQCKRITKMREGELLNVQYNEDGQRIGEGGKDLASYSGLLAESRISIVDYENWHAVGDEVRDLLWDTIKAKFNLTEDEKKGVVSDIGEKWKEFKSRLTRYYITPYKDQPEKLLKPPKKHEKNIRQEDWERFVKSRLTPKFQSWSWQAIPKRKRVFVKVVEALVDVEGMVLLKYFQFCMFLVDRILLLLAEHCSSLNSLLLYDGDSREGLHQFISRSRSNIQKLDLRLPENCVLSDAVYSLMVHSDGIQKLDLRLPENCVLSDERVFSLLVFISVLSDAVENGDGA